jgi:threonine/homoserine/homoserine lactone efflux protein
MVGFIVFLSQVFVISFTGALAPGPVTATAISMGTKNKYAGTLIALGHGIIELPLIILLLMGVSNFLEVKLVHVTISLTGGLFLIWMGVNLVRDITKPGYTAENKSGSGPIVAGIMLSAGHPFFLLWWLTVGLKYATEALEFGVLAVPVFFAVHWLCDLIWFQVLSYAAFTGSKIMGDRTLRTILAICGVALTAFGGYFIYDAIKTY